MGNRKNRHNSWVWAKIRALNITNRFIRPYDLPNSIITKAECLKEKKRLPVPVTKIRLTTYQFVCERVVEELSLTFNI